MAMNDFLLVHQRIGLRGTLSSYKPLKLTTIIPNKLQQKKKKNVAE